jgi:hypothetical protein
MYCAENVISQGEHRSPFGLLLSIRELLNGYPHVRCEEFTIIKGLEFLHNAGILHNSESTRACCSLNSVHDLIILQI